MCSPRLICTCQHPDFRGEPRAHRRRVTLTEKFRSSSKSAVCGAGTSRKKSDHQRSHTDLSHDTNVNVSVQLKMEWLRTCMITQISLQHHVQIKTPLSSSGVQTSSRYAVMNPFLHPSPMFTRQHCASIEIRHIPSADIP